ncbi:hypothetical protein BHE97_03590 [Aeromicrobium sp. PE09-221]|uniref:N-acetylglucosamine-6-phosphate deacetylase n=1 Tax=Aeromicrobium sp. PE09-221 TaxID=1898043 RepID=UPI000B3EAE29|nr:amidohydrolase family protein [Aeromicrobium sp. PE09-221]OUZ11968.1 hypothetical protein BHE97_03590 [Aeromicrobium sp. PE09-221]
MTPTTSSAPHAVRGRVIVPGSVLDDAVVYIDGQQIDDVRATAESDRELPFLGTVAPGFIDIHCHGGAGASFSSGDLDEVTTAARHHRARGSTTVLAGLVTDAAERLLRAVETAAEAAERDEVGGIYLEGPFLSPQRCGAQDPTHLRSPDVGLTAELVRAGRGHVRVMTLAPELPGADAVADLLLENGVIPAVGHTACSAAQTDRILRRGAPQDNPGLATHLFNGMPPLHHREPGPVGASLGAAADGHASVELIVDGVHLDDSIARLVFQALPGGGILLVSDAMAAAGMSDGTYRLGSQDVRVESGVARLIVDGQVVSIAGSTIHVADAVRRAHRDAGIDLATVVAAATEAPARVIGARSSLGVISRAARADLVILDDDSRVTRVMRRGRWLP